MKPLFPCWLWDRAVLSRSLNLPAAPCPVAPFTFPLLLLSRRAQAPFKASSFLLGQALYDNLFQLTQGQLLVT